MVRKDHVVSKIVFSLLDSLSLFTQQLITMEFIVIQANIAKDFDCVGLFATHAQ